MPTLRIVHPILRLETMFLLDGGSTTRQPLMPVYRQTNSTVRQMNTLARFRTAMRHPQMNILIRRMQLQTAQNGHILPYVMIA
jgi:hypothetical protein